MVEIFTASIDKFDAFFEKTQIKLMSWLNVSKLSLMEPIKKK